MIGPWLHKAAVASGNSLSLPPNTTRRKMQMRPARPDGNGVSGAEWMGLNMREGRGRMRRQPRIMAPLISVAASNAALPERRFMHARGV